jgi:hypothetical protein
MYGTEGAFQEVPGNAGRLINFDKYFGVNVFSGMDMFAGLCDAELHQQCQ